MSVLLFLFTNIGFLYSYLDYEIRNIKQKNFAKYSETAFFILKNKKSTIYTRKGIGKNAVSYAMKRCCNRHHAGTKKINSGIFCN